MTPPYPKIPLLQSATKNGRKGIQRCLEAAPAAAAAAAAAGWSGPVGVHRGRCVFAAGVASVGDWRFFKAGLYKIKAACDGCLSAFSAELRVVSSSLFALQLLQQPAASSSSGAPIHPAPVLQAVDAFDNVVEDIKGDVAVQLIPSQAQTKLTTGEAR